MGLWHGSFTFRKSFLYPIAPYWFTVWRSFLLVWVLNSSTIWKCRRTVHKLGMTFGPVCKEKHSKSRNFWTVSTQKNRQQLSKSRFIPLISIQCKNSDITGNKIAVHWSGKSSWQTWVWWRSQFQSEWERLKLRRRFKVSDSSSAQEIEEIQN